MDLKLLSIEMGHLGWTAVQVCAWCDATKYEVREGVERTFNLRQDLKGTALKMLEELKNAKNNSQRNKIRKSYGLCNVPLLDAIEADCMVPPPLHIIMGIFTILYDSAEKIDSAK